MIGQLVGAASSSFSSSAAAVAAAESVAVVVAVAAEAVALPILAGAGMSLGRSDTRELATLRESSQMLAGAFDAQP
jgi:hypothetical protein